VVLNGKGGRERKEGHFVGRGASDFLLYVVWGGGRFQMFGVETTVKPRVSSMDTTVISRKGRSPEKKKRGGQREGKREPSEQAFLVGLRLELRKEGREHRETSLKKGFAIGKQEKRFTLGT